jgi:hypothetical protein
MNKDLEAKQAITEAIHRYTRGEDRSDGQLSATVWGDDTMLDYGNVFRCSASDFVKNTDNRMAKFFGTHHQVGNVLINVDGDSATSEAYVTARCWNFVGDEGELTENTAVGRYLDRWVLEDGKWRSADRHFVLDIMYSWSPPRIPGGGTLTPPDRNPEAPEGRHHEADPSYGFVGNIVPKAIAGTAGGDLEAKQAITEAIHRYTRGEDRIDRDLSRTVWTEDAFLNYGNVFKTTVAEFVENNVGLSSFIGTHHQVGNVLIDVEGDNANSEAYVTARCWNFVGDEGELVELIAIGRYCDRWVRKDGKWRSADRHFILDIMYSWSPSRIPGGKTLIGPDRNPGALEGRRRPDDPSYDFVANLARKAAAGESTGSLEDKQAITEGLHRYTRGEDRADGELSRTVWTEDAALDYGNVFKTTGPEFTGLLAFSSPDQPSPFFATHHQVGNVLIDVEGDRANSEAYVTAKCWNYFGDSGELTELMAIGRYCDRWTRLDGNWRIAHRHFVLDMMYSWLPPRIPGGGTLSPADRNRNAPEGGHREADPSHERMAALTRKAALV